MFDIRNYNKTKEAKDEKSYWTIAFLKEVDSNFPKINEECEKLVNGINPNTEDAFNKKIDNWGEFVKILQRLCKLYKINGALCLSNEN